MVLNDRLDSILPATASRTSTVARISAENRVWAVVGVALATLAVGMLIATLLLLRLSDQALDATSSEIQYATAMSAAALNAKAIANDERGYLLSGDDEFLVQIDSRVPLAREAFAQAMEVADDAQRQRLTEILQLFEHWLVLVEDEIATFRAGNEEAAWEASVGQTREVRHEYERILTEASLIQSGVPRAQATISSSSGWSLAILLGYLVVAILVGLVVGAWAVAGLRSPGRDAGAEGAATLRRSDDPEVPGP
jgi:methyl-accepting chemotaxis protein